MSSVHFDMGASCFSQNTGCQGPWWTLANRMLLALCLLLYGGGWFYSFHSPRLANLFSLQNVEDDGQVCHFMSFIVPFQNQLRVFHFHTAPNIHLLSNSILWSEITVLSSLCADLAHVLTQIWSRPHKPLNQLNWWSRKLQHETGTFKITFV